MYYYGVCLQNANMLIPVRAAANWGRLLSALSAIPFVIVQDICDIENHFMLYAQELQPIAKGPCRLGVSLLLMAIKDAKME